MKEGMSFESTLLRALLDKELERFRLTLEEENPGLSKAEIDRYMRAARLFVAQLAGNRPRTHGRKARSVEDGS
jgi:hypothetical protein